MPSCRKSTARSSFSQFNLQLCLSSQLQSPTKVHQYFANCIFFLRLICSSPYFLNRIAILGDGVAEILYGIVTNNINIRTKNFIGGNFYSIHVQYTENVNSICSRPIRLPAMIYIRLLTIVFYFDFSLFLLGYGTVVLVNFPSLHNHQSLIIYSKCMICLYYKPNYAYI